MTATSTNNDTHTGDDRDRRLHIATELVAIYSEMLRRAQDGDERSLDHLINCIAKENK